MSAEPMAGPRLPSGVVELLDGHDLEAGVGLTIQLLTADESGWPRVALLSVGEVLVLDDSILRLALWPGSRTTANLTRTGRATLAFVHDHASYTLQVEARRAADLAEPAERAVFCGRVAALQRDEVPYAVLTTGIAFDLPDPAPVLERWRTTIDALRRATAPSGGSA
jgi:hypothetical protein